MTLAVSGLTKRYGDVAVVGGIDFDVAPGEFLSLLGPSGCGKTTTLRCIAGFERPDAGIIRFGDEVLNDPARGIFVPPNRRRFGMVFQSYAVWPHMTVSSNVAYPLQVRGGIPRASIRDRVAEALRQVGLEALAARYPSQLSGGQQQRVALARALVMEPRALLFDEPLSNLDAKLRERMRFELVEIQARLSIPAVYVTHDQAEAMALSRRILVMERGRISQAGSPQDVYTTPSTRFVADFIGASNFLEAEIVRESGTDRWLVSAAFGLQECVSTQPHQPGERVLLFIRPERLHVATQRGTGDGWFAAEFRQGAYLGPYWDCFLAVDGLLLRAQCADAPDVAPGASVHCRVAPQDCRIVAENDAN